jgi:fucose 4-O-acetylase-like acetyltransferase
MGRIVWIDATKGYAILLVVFGHVLGGAMARGWLSQADGDAPKVIYDFIYSFHMPLFFLIAGALGIKGIRTDPGRALLSRVGSIAWPYVLWGMIAIFVYPLVSQFRLNAPHAEWGLYEPLKGLLLGQSSWFLRTLFLAQCILILALQIIPIQLILVSSVMAFLALANKDLGTLSALIRFMPFLALGAVIGRRIDIPKFRPIGAPVAFGGLLFGGLFVLVRFSTNEIALIFLFCGIVGCLAGLIIIRSLDGTWPNRIMAKCGAASLVVFLLHPYFQGTARELGVLVVGPSLWWQLTIPTAAGVVVPTLIWLAAERCGVQWLFRLDVARLGSRWQIEKRSVG